MKDMLKNLLEVWFVGNKSQFWNENRGISEYFRSEFKNDAAYAYEYWKCTGKMNWSA
jgi:hypothetical protein